MTVKIGEELGRDNGTKGKKKLTEISFFVFFIRYGCSVRFVVAFL